MGRRGFGFVTFVEESAARACAATRHHELHGTFIDVKEDEKYHDRYKTRICKYGPRCPYLRTGDCQYLHPEEEEYAATQARIEQYAPAPPAPAPPPAPPPPPRTAPPPPNRSRRGAPSRRRRRRRRSRRSRRRPRGRRRRCPGCPVRPRGPRRRRPRRRGRRRPLGLVRAERAGAAGGRALARDRRRGPAGVGGRRRAPARPHVRLGLRRARGPRGRGAAVELLARRDHRRALPVADLPPRARRRRGGRRGQSDALRYLGDAFRASAEGSDAGVDAAVDGLRAALAKRSNDETGEGVRSELATGGAHLDVAEVLGEVVAVLGSAKRCRGAALALRTRGHIHQQACRKCGHRNADFRDDVAFDELARSAPAAALVHAARSDGGSVADVFRDAHAHAAKSSATTCRAPGACEVDVVLDHAAKALVLSLAWYSTDQEGDDVAALLELVWRDARLPAKRVFSSIGKVKFEVDLFAVAVFQNAHYTAFVRARDGSDSWTYHDRRRPPPSGRSRTSAPRRDGRHAAAIWSPRRAGGRLSLMPLRKRSLMLFLARERAHCCGAGGSAARDISSSVSVDVGIR